MKFRLPSTEAKATIEFFDENGWSISRITKTPQINRNGNAIVMLEPDDIPVGSKKAQLVFEHEDRVGRSRMQRVESPAQDTPSVPQPNDVADASQKLISLFTLGPKIAAQRAEYEQAVREQSKRSILYKTMTDEERQDFVIRLYRQGAFELGHMSQQELSDWQAVQALEHKKFDSGLWNYENHGPFIRSVKQFLAEEDIRSLDALLEAKRWGNAELKQAKEMVEVTRHSK